MAPLFIIIPRKGDVMHDSLDHEDRTYRFTLFR